MLTLWLPGCKRSAVLSCRVLDLILKVCWFRTHKTHCGVVFEEDTFTSA